MITFYYVFCNGSFYGYYTVENFHNSVMYRRFMSDDCFSVYSVTVDY